MDLEPACELLFFVVPRRFQEPLRNDKFRRIIGGCGCCGSPFLLNVNSKVVEYRLLAEELLLDIDEQKYTVKDSPESGNFKYDGEFYVYSKEKDSLEEFKKILNIVNKKEND
ncbi:MAG: hypothetical protein WA125_02995 [Desulfosporosinus sp.]